MLNIDKVAETADMIVNGYAFTKCDSRCRVLNLNKPNCAVVLSEEGEILETTMDDIEVQIVKDYYQRNRNLMED